MNNYPETGGTSLSVEFAPTQDKNISSTESEKSKRIQDRIEDGQEPYNSATTAGGDYLSNKTIKVTVYKLKKDVY